MTTPLCPARLCVCPGDPCSVLKPPPVQARLGLPDGPRVSAGQLFSHLYSTPAPTGQASYLCSNFGQRLLPWGGSRACLLPPPPHPPPHSASPGREIWPQFPNMPCSLLLLGQHSGREGPFPSSQQARPPVYPPPLQEGGGQGVDA